MNGYGPNFPADHFSTAGIRARTSSLAAADSGSTAVNSRMPSGVTDSSVRNRPTATVAR